MPHTEAGKTTVHNAHKVAPCHMSPGLKEVQYGHKHNSQILLLVVQLHSQQQAAALAHVSAYSAAQHKHIKVDSYMQTVGCDLQQACCCSCKPCSHLPHIACSCRVPRKCQWC
jgi:hypothetical protein